MSEDIKSWFKDHVATFSTFKDENGNTIEKLIWKKPDSGICMVNYTLFGRYLIVTGDLGHAIYSWGQNINFKWVSECDLGYFAAKCDASENGRLYKDWDSELVIKKIKNEFRERASSSGGRSPQ